MKEPTNQSNPEMSILNAAAIYFHCPIPETHEYINGETGLTFPEEPDLISLTNLVFAMEPLVFQKDVDPQFMKYVKNLRQKYSEVLLVEALKNSQREGLIGINWLGSELRVDALPKIGLDLHHGMLPKVTGIARDYLTPLEPKVYEYDKRELKKLIMKDINKKLVRSQSDLMPEMTALIKKITPYNYVLGAEDITEFVALMKEHAPQNINPKLQKMAQLIEDTKTLNFDSIRNNEVLKKLSPIIIGSLILGASGAAEQMKHLSLSEALKSPVAYGASILADKMIIQVMANMQPEYVDLLLQSPSLADFLQNGTSDRSDPGVVISELTTLAGQQVYSDAYNNLPKDVQNWDQIPKPIFESANSPPHLEDLYPDDRIPQLEALSSLKNPDYRTGVEMVQQAMKEYESRYGGDKQHSQVYWSPSKDKLEINDFVRAYVDSNTKEGSSLYEDIYSRLSEDQKFLLEKMDNGIRDLYDASQVYNITHATQISNEQVQIIVSDYTGFLMSERSQSGKPASMDTFMAYALHKNNGDLRLALWDMAMVARMLTRNSIISGNQQGGEARYNGALRIDLLQDNFSERYTAADVANILPEARYWNISLFRDSAVLIKDYDPTNLSGIDYNMLCVLAMSSDFSPSLVIGGVLQEFAGSKTFDEYGRYKSETRLNWPIKNMGGYTDFIQGLPRTPNTALNEPSSVQVLPLPMFDSRLNQDSWKALTAGQVIELDGQYVALGGTPMRPFLIIGKDIGDVQTGIVGVPNIIDGQKDEDGLLSQISNGSAKSLKLKTDYGFSINGPIDDKARLIAEMLDMSIDDKTLASMVDFYNVDRKALLRQFKESTNGGDDTYWKLIIDYPENFARPEILSTEDIQAIFHDPFALSLLINKYNDQWSKVISPESFVTYLKSVYASKDWMPMIIVEQTLDPTVFAGHIKDSDVQAVLIRDNYYKVFLDDDSWNKIWSQEKMTEILQVARPDDWQEIKREYIDTIGK